MDGGREGGREGGRVFSVVDPQDVHVVTSLLMCVYFSGWSVNRGHKSVYSHPGPHHYHLSDHLDRSHSGHRLLLCWSVLPFRMVRLPREQ